MYVGGSSESDILSRARHGGRSRGGWERRTEDIMGGGERGACKEED